MLVITSSIFYYIDQGKCYEITNETNLNKDGQFVSSERYPQTIIYDSVTEFLSDDNLDKDKKVLVLGYDGFREDALNKVIGDEQGAIHSVMNEGGLYHSYAGAHGEQETSTAPGWLSILSGKWAYTLGVPDNSGIKPLDVDTFLSNAVNLGYPSTFIASWSEHFDVTYQNDINQQEGKPVYQKMINDEETVKELHNVLSDTSEESYDITFAVLEYTDHAGHTYGFGNNSQEYVDAVQQADRKAYDILQTIYNRETYKKEDWLIILTTDHGGYEYYHGGQRDDETQTWIAVNKNLSIWNQD